MRNAALCVVWPAVASAPVGEGLLARTRAQPPDRQCGCTTRPCVKGSCTQPLSVSHDLQPFWTPCEAWDLGPTQTTHNAALRI